MKRKVNMLGIVVVSWFVFGIAIGGSFILWPWAKRFLDRKFRPTKIVKLGAGGRLLAVWRSNILAKLFMPYVITSAMALLVFLFLWMMISFIQTLLGLMAGGFDMSNWITNFKWMWLIWILSNVLFIWYWRWRWTYDKYVLTSDGMRHIAAGIPIVGLLLPFLPQVDIIIDSLTKFIHIEEIKSATDVESLMLGEKTGFLSDVFSRFLTKQFGVKDVILLSRAKYAEDILRKLDGADQVISFILEMIKLFAKQDGRKKAYETSANSAETSVLPWNKDAAEVAREVIEEHFNEMFPDAGEIDLFFTEDPGVFSEFCSLAREADMQM